MDELNRIISMQGLVRQIETTLSHARSMRDAAIYDYVQDPDVNRRELCRQLGLSSPRLYAILAGESDRREFGDEADLLWRFREETTVQLWQEAQYAWREAGEVGDPEDYFDLNSLHVRL